MCPLRSVTSRSAEPLPWRHPYARAGLHYRLQGRNQAAGGVPHGDAPVALAFVDVRLAIRDDHHFLAVQMPSQRQLQALRRPGAPFEFGFPLDHDPFDQIANIAHDGLKFGTLRCFAAGQDDGFPFANPAR